MTDLMVRSCIGLQSSRRGFSYPLSWRERGGEKGEVKAPL